eukprot:tig00021127_g18747.t1
MGWRGVGRGGGRGLRERSARLDGAIEKPSKPVPRRQRFLRALIFVDYVGVTMLYVASDEDTSVYSFSSSTADLLALALLRAICFLPAVWPVRERYSRRQILYVAAVAAVFGAALCAKGAAAAPAGGGGSAVAAAAVAYSALFVLLQAVAFAALAGDEETGPGAARAEAVGGGAEEEKGKKEAEPLKPGQLAALARPEAHVIAAGCLCALASAGSTLALPAFIGRIIDVIGSSPSRDAGLAQLRAAMLALVGIALAGGVASFFRSYLLSLASERVVARLRKRLFGAVVAQEVAFFDTTRTGELVNRLSGDCQVIQSAVTQNIAQLLRSALQAAAGLVLLLSISWRLTLLMLAVTPAVSIGAVSFGRFMKAVGRQVQEALALATVAAEEAISNIRTVRSFSREARELERYSARVDEAYRMAMRTAVGYAAFDCFVSAVSTVAVVLVLFYGGRLALDGLLSPGRLLSFVLYMIFVGTALGGISRIYADFAKAAGAGARVFELLERKPAVNIEGGLQPAGCAGEVRFEGVAFAYPARPEREVLSGVSLHLRPGQVVALVGPSGGGKTTVVNLLERFYEASAGRITVDGVDLRELDPRWLHRHVALVSQEPVLFAASVEENIRYGVHDEARADQAAVERAARQANAHDFITHFPEQYGTLVGERGIRLSGGQKQRIAIARALLMDPRILLLDEATSALDAESEHVVHEALQRLMAGRTVLVIAHRLSTVKDADLVCVVSGGRIVEQARIPELSLAWLKLSLRLAQGRHEELLGRPGGLYRSLVRRQLAHGSGLLDPDAPGPPPAAGPAPAGPASLDGEEGEEEGAEGEGEGEDGLSLGRGGPARGSSPSLISL